MITYGPKMVQLTSDIMKITNYVRDQHLAMFETSILPQEPKTDYSEYLLK